jgi:hypothetical protein
VLRLFSSSPLEVEQLPSPLSLVLGGQWAGLLAGGPASASTFGSNPQYMISTPHKSEVCNLAGGSFCGSNPQYMISTPHKSEVFMLAGGKFFYGSSPPFHDQHAAQLLRCGWGSGFGCSWGKGRPTPTPTERIIRIEPKHKVCIIRTETTHTVRIIRTEPTHKIRTLFLTAASVLSRSS